MGLFKHKSYDAGDSPDSDLAEPVGFFGSRKAMSFFKGLLEETEVLNTLDNFPSLTLFAPNNTCLRSLHLPWSEILHHPSDVDKKRDFITSFILLERVAIDDLVQTVHGSDNNHAQWDTLSGRPVTAKLSGSNVIITAHHDIVLELGEMDIPLKSSMAHIVERCSHDKSA